jgi:hypothetical protein
VPASLQAPLRDLQAFETLANEPALTVMPFRLMVK